MNLTSTMAWGDTITRTQLYNMWSTATVSSADQDDLADTFLEVLSSSSATDPVQDGRVWFDKTNQLLKLYVEVLNNTTVSLWLAMGPDTWEDAFLAEESIPPRALLEFSTTQEGRWAKRHGKELYPSRAVAVSGLDTTAASGTWFQGVVYGYCKMWAAQKPTASTYSGLAHNTYNQARYFCPSDHTEGAVGQGSANLGEPLPGTLCAWNLTYSNVTNNDFYPYVFFFGVRETES